MIRRRLAAALDWRFRALASRLEALERRGERIESLLEERVAAIESLLEERVGAIERLLEQRGERIEHLLEGRLEPMLRALFEEEAENRRRLFAARAAEDYELPFSRPEPLVTVTIPTRDRPRLLTERALPSVLAQSHEKLEVLVVGDAAEPALAERLAALGDARVRFANLTQRTVAHPDPVRHWLAGSTMPRNEATRLARGDWLLHFDDDDALRPHAIETLLARARETHAEVAYGGFEAHGPQGPLSVHKEFPPRAEQFGWQGALVHRGLRFFERELTAAALEEPGDMLMLRRMLRVGVRFALADAILWDYYPSLADAAPATSASTSQSSSRSDGGIPA